MKKLYLFSFFFLTFFFYLSGIRVCAMESITDTQSAAPIKKDILLGESRILIANNNEAKDLYKEKEKLLRFFLITVKLCTLQKKILI
jgi:hypothetical protein